MDIREKKGRKQGHEKKEKREDVTLQVLFRLSARPRCGNWK